jgi:DNA modification methylase
MTKIEYYIDEFKSYLSLSGLTLSKSLIKSCEILFDEASKKNVELNTNGAICRAIKKKLKLEAVNSKSLIDACAQQKIFFNALEKKRILDWYCESNIKSLSEILIYKGIEREQVSELLSEYPFLTELDTLHAFHEQFDNPINNRTKKVDFGLKVPMIESIFSSYFYECFDESFIHCVNSGVDRQNYRGEYWAHIHESVRGDYSREHALTYIDLDAIEGLPVNYNDLRSFIAILIKNIYEKQNNHTYAFIKIPSHIASKWCLANDIILFAEKFIERVEKIGYFKPEKIAQVTSDALGLELDSKLFDKVNEGFLYKDCFVLYEDAGEMEPSLLLSFRKDERDETKIPCPKCRSLVVQGNSYPSLGVKSWECKNLLCEDRSMSNRGKRYSFESLLKQRSIECPDSQIPKKLLARWKRDIIYNVSPGEDIEYIIRCYSLPDDTIHILSTNHEFKVYNRHVECFDYSNANISEPLWVLFESSDFFKRWVDIAFNHSSLPLPEENLKSLNFNKSRILVGDSESSLTLVKDNSVDAAVTSPPYYNAREYSQFENIYIYLVKMLRVAEQVYRTLKPGGYFAYNIFDYFDNENIVATSALGQKRMILSSYIKYGFEKIGFEYTCNVPWDKGEIEGKRAYNLGNNTPYYQSPLNCWEHIMIFRKPGGDTVTVCWPKVLKCKAVHKIVKGVNTFGHTAPYPIEIPDIVSSRLLTNSIVLDPFSGSGTTGLSAKKFNHDFILCEALGEYVELIQKRLELN